MQDIPYTYTEYVNLIFHSGVITITYRLKTGLFSRPPRATAAPQMISRRGLIAKNGFCYLVHTSIDIL